MAKKTRRKRAFNSCLCHSGRPYPACCAPYHKGEAFPEDPTVLMRSRYCAYAKGLAPYIIKTTHPLNPDAQEDVQTREAEIQKFSRTTSFDGLIVVDAGFREGDEEDWGWVHFAARLNQGGHDASFEEISQFARDDDGRWAYVDGQMMVED